jgi:hypothetical protein
MFEGIPLDCDPLGYDWLMIVVLAALLLFSTTITINRLYLRNISSLFRFRNSSQPTDDPRQVYRWEMTITNLAAITSISLFIYVTLVTGMLPVDLKKEGGSLYLLLLAGTSASLSARHISTLVIRDLSRSRVIFGEYIVTIHTVWQLTGMILLPVSASLLYLKNPHVEMLGIAGGSIIILLYMLRLIRLMSFFIRRRVSIIYYILYICALELLPIALVARILENL